VLAGDTHNAWASALTLKGLADPALAGVKVGEEFATSSVSSPGLESYLPLPPAQVKSIFENVVDDLNWIDPNALVPEFREVMSNTASGELSKPFKSPYGWHVLQVLGRRATDNSEEFRKQQAANLLRNRKYDEELQAWLRQIRDEAYVEIKL